MSQRTLFGSESQDFLSPLSSESAHSGAQEPSPRSSSSSMLAAVVQRKLARRLAQRRASGQGSHDSQAEGSAALDAAERGVSGAGQSLPHLDRIQSSFGGHDVSGVSAHVGGQAAVAADQIGAQAYATGSSVAFRDTPDLHTAAHEAAHVVQQRAGVQLLGGVGQEGDSYERHADQVADAVVRGESAAPILDQMAGGGQQSGVQRLVQKKGEKGEPEIEATPEAMGKQIVDDMNAANAPALGRGLQYWYNAKPMIDRAGGKWKDGFRYGHHFTSWTNPASPFFTQPDETGHFMRFELKPGQSASAALHSWLNGPTIAECLSSVYAMETDAVRAAIGDVEFDKRYGSKDPAEDKAVRAANRQLVISADTRGNDTTVAKEGLLTSTDFSKKNRGKSEKDLSASDFAMLKPGEWYYFKNHPKYLTKHPGGAWQGENSIYMGEDPRTHERLWAGLGAGTAPEHEMFESMMSDYNRERDDEDRRVMVERGMLVLDEKGTETVNGKKYRYADESYKPSGFPDQVDEKSIKDAGGGLLVNSGFTINAPKVAAMRKK